MTKITPSRLEKRVDKAILDALAPLGFSRDATGGAFCDRGDVFLYIGGLTLSGVGTNRIMPFGQVGFAQTNRIYFSFMDPGRPTRKATGDFQVEYRHFAGERDAYISCATDEDVPAALDEVRALVMDKLLPCLAKHTDPREVLRVYVVHDEHELNSLGLVGAHNYSTALSGLILARLYGPHHYAPLKRRYQFFFDPLIPEVKEKALSLIAYLDRDPLPPL